MTQRIIMVMLLMVFGMYSMLSAQEKTESLEQLVQEAVLNNPQLRALAHSVKADEAKIPQAGSLPDPVLSVNIMNVPVESWVFDQEAMTGKQIALMQMFPFFGKLGLREDIASAAAAVTESQHRELLNQLIRDVKNTYYTLFFIEQSIKTVQKNRDLLTEFVKIAETKYSVGKGLQQDVLKAQVELSKMTDKLITFREKRQALEAKMNALLNRPAGTDLGHTSEPGITPVSQDLEEFKRQARENRPLIQAWEAMRLKSRKAIDLAKKGYWPDFSIGLAYTQRDKLSNGMGGADFLSGGISLNLPIYSGTKQSKKVEETQLTQKAVDQRYLNVINTVNAGLDKGLSDIRKNTEQLDLYRTGIIPQASQSLQSAMTGYQTDKVDFLTLINNQMTLFNFELDYFRILSDYNKTVANLEFISGVTLDKQ